MRDWLVHVFDGGSEVCDAWCLQFWEVLGVWFAGIATLAAVFVALWLARRDSTVHLRVNAYKRVVIERGPNAAGQVDLHGLPDMLYIEVTNVGSRSVRITSVGYHWWCIRGPGIYQNPPTHSGGFAALPTILEHGQMLQWTLDYDEILDDIARHMLAPSRCWQIKLHFLRVRVGTSVGATKVGRFEKRILIDLAGRVRKARASTPTTT